MCRESGLEERRVTFEDDVFKAIVEDRYVDQYLLVFVGGGVVE